MTAITAAGTAATLRQLYAIARADLLDRMRRYSYLVTLAGTLYFVYLVNAGNVRLSIDGQRGIYNSAWIGTLMALSVGGLLSLIGFYLVKNTLDRDRRTGVGEILAATPLSRAAYTLGKTLSNFLLLASILALLAVAAGVTQLLAREETHLELAALLMPMAALAVPPVALAAALAVLFESVSWLRGSLGNVIFFFLWSAGLSLSAIGPGGGDLLGFRLVESSFARQLAPPAGAPAAGRHSGISLNIGPGDAGDETEQEAASTEARNAAEEPRSRQQKPATRLSPRAPRPPRPSGIRWPGIEWTAAVLGGRLAWLGLPLAIALFASLPFTRFDPARERRRVGRRGSRAAPPLPDAAVPGEAPDQTAATAEPPGDTTSTPARSGWMPRSRALGLVIAELRLMLRGRGFWWLAAAAGLWIGGLAAPAGEARATLLALAWIWPLALWSELGAREALHGTRPLLLSAPLPPGLQCAATWAAGAGVTALAGSGVALRMAFAGDARGLLGWLAGCLFIPALALALGTLAGSPRPFEVVYLLLWYAGPMNHVAELDYTGATLPARAAGVAWIYLALAAALFAVAWAARSRPERG
jgi:hypothetical protein